MVLGSVLGALAVSVYVATLYPSVAGGDSGELTAVAYTLGTAHPPGYPLYTLLGQLFTWLPLGSIAWRVNLLSAVLDAAAAVPLYLAVTRWSRQPWAGFLAGGLFAFAPLVWSYAVAAEVFALNNVIVAALLYLGVSFRERHDPIFAYGAALTLGLGVANHHTIVLFGIPYALWFLLEGRATLLRGPVLARLVGLAVLGLLPHLYLPLAGARLPVMSWGDFSGVSGFLDHFLRRDYGTLQLGAGEHHTQLWNGIVSFLAEIPVQVFVVGAGLAGWGVAARLRHEGPVGPTAMLAVGFGGYLLVFHSLANLPIEQALFYGVVARFWQLPTLIVCAWAGLGLAALAAALPEGRPGRLLVAASAVAIVSGQAAVHYETQDQHDNYTIRDYGRAILEGLPPDTLLVSLGDLETNSVRYLQLCEGLRTDVRVLDRAMLAYPWTRKVVQANLPDVTLPAGRFSRRTPRDGRTSSLGRLIALNADHFPIFLSRLNAEEDTTWQTDFAVWPHGVLDRVVAVDESIDLPHYLAVSDAAQVALRSSARQDWPETSWESYAWDKYRDAEFQRGLRLLYHAIDRQVDREALEAARHVFEQLAAVHPDPSAALLKNLGLTYRYLSESDPTLTTRMAEWWRRYLLVAPASDAEVPEIRRLVAEADARPRTEG